MLRLRLLTLALAFGLVGFAQPANDDCSGATPLIMGGPESCIPVTGDNTGATDSGIAPGCANYQGGDIWFTLTVPSTGIAIIETSADTAPNAITDGGLAVYSGPDCDNLTLLECNDDGGDGLFSLIELTGLTPGDQLYIAVWRYAASQEGTVNICAYQPPVCPDLELFSFQADSTSADYISVTWESLSPGSTYSIEYGPSGFTPGTGTTVTGITGTDGPPVEFTGLELFSFYDFYLSADCGGGFATDTISQTFNTTPGLLTNDDCDGAIPLPVNGQDDCQPTAGFNDGATDSGVAHSCANYQGGDVWFSFVAPSSGNVIVETSGTGGFTDGGLAVYSGACGALVEVACNDDGGEGLFSLVEGFGLTPGDTYYAAVWEYGGDVTGAFNICAYEGPTCPNPAQFSFFPDSVSATDAFITWTVANPGSGYVIEYGEDGFTPGTGMIATGIVGVDGPPVQLAGLNAATTYNYYFQGVCEPGDSTDVMGPYFFTTLETCQSTNLFEINTDTVGFDFVTISWPEYNPGATFIIEFGAPGFTLGTGSVISGVVGVDGPPVTIPGLFLGSNYELYLQEACTETDSTMLTGPYFFETESLPPANDNLCDATEIIVNADEVYLNNEGSTFEMGEPLGSCFGGNNLDTINNLETIWAFFTAPASGEVTVSTDFLGTELDDTHIAIYELAGGDCTDLTSLVEVGCDEDGGTAGDPGDYLSIADLSGLTEGELYYIQVDGWDGLDGEFGLTVFENTISVEEYFDNGFEMYPNPAEDIVTIASASLNGSVTIEVMDLKGRMVYTEKTILEATRPARLDISELESGVYMIRLMNEDGFSVQRLIVE